MMMELLLLAIDLLLLLALDLLLLLVLCNDRLECLLKMTRGICKP